MRSQAQWLEGEQAFPHYQPIHSLRGELGPGALCHKKGASRANFHPTTEHLMSCEVEVACAVSPLPSARKGLDPPPAHRAASLAEHVSIPQHPGIQHGMSHPHCTLLAKMQLEKKKKGLGLVSSA